MKACVLLLASALAVLPGWAQAQVMDALQVRSMAASCAACHGPQGMTQLGFVPLAGARQDALLKKMLDFKTGSQPATLMHQIAKGYTDEQLAALAAYFSALKK